MHRRQPLPQQKPPVLPPGKNRFGEAKVSVGREGKRPG
jgi:hypothetical protein